MENILYEHDYSEEHKQAAENSESNQNSQLLDTAIETGFFKAYSDAMWMIPKIINPVSQANYEYVKGICDNMAKRWGGKIRAEVRYDKWDGIIELTLPFVEFGGPDELNNLKEIAQRVDSVTFSPSDNGGVQVFIFFYYFDDLASADEKEEVFMDALTSRPELYKALLLKMQSEGEDVQDYLKKFFEENEE